MIRTDWRARRAVTTLCMFALGAHLTTCQGPPTEVVLRVDTDMDQGPTRTLTAVQVRAWQSSPERATTRRFELLGGADRPLLPAEVGLVPADEEGGAFVAEVTALQGERVLFTHRVTAAYEPGHTGLVEVFLPDRCRREDALCLEGETCTEVGCAPATRREPLAPYTPLDPDARSLRVFAPPETTRCAVDEAPLPDGRGRARVAALGYTCAAVGAVMPVAGEWPDLAGVTGPVLYVRAGALDGDGTIAHPLGDLGTALVRAKTPGTTLALARGTFSVAMPLRLRRDLAVIARGATLDVARGTPAFLVGAHTLELRGLTIRYARTEGPEDPHNVGIDADTGARVTLRDVAVHGAFWGVRARGALLVAQGLTVAGCGAHGVILDASSVGELDRVTVRECGGSGLVTRDSRLRVSGALIADNRFDGVQILGTPAGVTGATDCLTDLAALRNGAFAVSVEGPRGVELVGVTLSATRAVSGAGGDGLFIGSGASATLGRARACTEGHARGSEVLGNHRAGVLVDGGRFEAYGAVLASNRGPGVYVQGGGALVALGDVRVEDVGSLGVATTTGARLGRVDSVTIAGVRAASVATDRGAARVGDGLSVVAPGQGSAVEVTDCTFESNARFGAVFVRAAARVRGASGAGNRYGLGAYGALDLDSTVRVSGDAPPPRDEPEVADGRVVNRSPPTRPTGCARGGCF